MGYIPLYIYIYIECICRYVYVFIVILCIYIYFIQYVYINIYGISCKYNVPEEGSNQINPINKAFAIGIYH